MTDPVDEMVTVRSGALWMLCQMAAELEGLDELAVEKWPGYADMDWNATYIEAEKMYAYYAGGERE